MTIRHIRNGIGVTPAFEYGTGHALSPLVHPSDVFFCCQKCSTDRLAAVYFYLCLFLVFLLLNNRENELLATCAFDCTTQTLVTPARSLNDVFPGGNCSTALRDTHTCVEFASYIPIVSMLCTAPRKHRIARQKR